MKPMPVLIVDDDPDDRYLLSRQLRQTGQQFLEKFKAICDDPDVTSSVVIMFTSPEEQKDVDKSLSYEFVRDIW